MRKMKKVTCGLMVLAIVPMIFSGMQVTDVTGQMISGENHYMESQDNLEEVDIYLAAHYYLSSAVAEESCWSENTQISSIVPLYDSVEEIVAYYIKLSNGTYAVINNNVNNPCAIEFGKGDNYQIEEILSMNSDNACITYASPYEVGVLGTPDEFGISTVGEKTYTLYENYPDLLDTDEALVKELAQQKELLKQSASVQSSWKGDGDYGIYDAKQLPPIRYTAKNISNIDNVDWWTVYDYEGYANNHCGAVCVTNFALYYANCGYSNLIEKNSKLQTFLAVHAIVGDGPKMAIGEEIREYFSRRGVTIFYIPAYEYEDVKTALSEGRPCGMLLRDAILNWHWVMGVGWRTYSYSDVKYIRVVDGFVNSSSRYYRWNEKATFYTANQYWIQ